MTHSSNKTFPCPRCGEATIWSGNDFRPFCSAHCKLIDLGAWANEDYRIPTQDGKSHVIPEHDQD